MRRALVAAVTAALLFGNTAIAMGADMCLIMQFEGHAYTVNTLILKAFSLPVRGTCKETRGFYTGGQYSAPAWVTGMACASSDGDHVTFFHTGVRDTGKGMISDKFTFDRRFRTGLGRECFPDTGGDGSCYSETMRWTEVLCGGIVPVP
jgi:hypothetical protein